MTYSENGLPRWYEMAKNYIKLTFQMELCRKRSCHLAFWLTSLPSFRQILFNPDHTVCPSSWFMKTPEHEPVAEMSGKWQNISCWHEGCFPVSVAKQVSPRVCMLECSQLWSQTNYPCHLSKMTSAMHLGRGLLLYLYRCSKINYKNFKTQC